MKFFSQKDRKVLRQYLEEYRDGAWTAFLGRHQEQENQQQNNLTVSYSSPFMTRISDKPIVIGHCTFPALTKEMLEQPYMILPKELSSKQRRVVHEVCADGKK